MIRHVRRPLGVCLILILFLYLAQSCLLDCPPVWPDEAYIADISRNLMQRGQISTNLWGTMIPGAQESVLWYPPGIFYLYSSFFKIFGLSVEGLRGLSTVFGVLVLVVFFTLIRNYSHSFPIAAIATILLGLDNFFLRASRIARPEIFVLFFGLLSFYLFYKTLQNSRLHPKGVIVGFTCALSALFHFSGLIFGAAILGHIIFLEKSKFLRSKRFIYFVLGFSAGFALWLPKLISNLPIFFEQIVLESQYRGLSPYFLHILFRSGSAYQIIITFLYIGISLYFIFYSKIDFKKYLCIYLALIFAWIFAIVGKIEWYVVLAVPFVYLAAILIFIKNFATAKKMIIILAVLILALNLKIYLDSLPKNDYKAFAAKVLEYIPKEKTVYVSAIPDPYFEFTKRGENHLFYFPPLPTSKENYLKVLEQSDFIVINSNFEAAFVGDALEKYLEENTKRQTDIEAGNYAAAVIELK